MKVSTNRTVFQALPAVQARTTSRVMPAHRDSTHFRGNDKAPATNNSAAPKAGIGQKLFGSPIKNVGWATAWGAAGGAALFGLPLFPFVAMGLAALGGLHLIAATWQFFTRKKGDAAKADSNKAETPPAEEKKEKAPLEEKATDSKATETPQPIPPAPEKTESTSSETVQEEVAAPKEEASQKLELPKEQEQSTQTPPVEPNDTQDDDSKAEKETSKGGVVAA